MRFEIFQTADSGRWVSKKGGTTFKVNPGQWYFRLKSGNNQIVAQSEGYSSKDGARKAAKAICKAFSSHEGVSINCIEKTP